jgi:hypothetical protein
VYIYYIITWKFPNVIRRSFFWIRYTIIPEIYILNSKATFSYIRHISWLKKGTFWCFQKSGGHSATPPPPVPRPLISAESADQGCNYLNDPAYRDVSLTETNISVRSYGIFRPACRMKLHCSSITLAYAKLLHFSQATQILSDFSVFLRLFTRKSIASGDRCIFNTCLQNKHKTK